MTAPIKSAARRLKDVPLYPAAVAAAIILGFYSATHVAVGSLWRPLAVSVLGTGALVLVVGGLTRRWHLAAFAATAAVVALFGLWLLLAVLAAARTAIAASSMRRRRGIGTTATLAYTFNVLAGAWLVVASVGAISAATAAPQPAIPRPIAISREDAPTSIYVILLDGYPRADTLAEYFGYDNRPFYAALEEIGFHVSERSHTDYATTLQTVPSMLHMDSAASLGLDPLTTDQEQRRGVGVLVNSSPVIATLRDAEYQIVSVIQAAAALEMRDADVLWEVSLLSPFEDSLLDAGVLNLISTEWRYADRRHAVRGAFDALAEIGSEESRGRFVYAHILSPHAPFAFTAEGRAASPVACEPWCDVGTTFLHELGMTLDELSGRFIGQLRYVNARVIETANIINTADPAAVIVFLSDHGSRLDRTDQQEWYRNFFAAYTPGRPGLFGDAPTPTNLFRVLFNAYFDTDLQMVMGRPAD